MQFENVAQVMELGMATNNVRDCKKSSFLVAIWYSNNSIIVKCMATALTGMERALRKTFNKVLK